MLKFTGLAWGNISHSSVLAPCIQDQISGWGGTNEQYMETTEAERGHKIAGQWYRHHRGQTLCTEQVTFSQLAVHVDFNALQSQCGCSGWGSRERLLYKSSFWNRSHHHQELEQNRAPSRGLGRTHSSLGEAQLSRGPAGTDQVSFSCLTVMVTFPLLGRCVLWKHFPLREE